MGEGDRPLTVITGDRKTRRRRAGRRRALDQAQRRAARCQNHTHRHAASSRTSTTSGRAWPPACSIASAAEWIVPSSLGCGVSVLAAIAILAPSRAARSAIASPMPREAR